MRLIPARAGNTLHPAVTPCVSSAHPRSRGEHSRQQQEEAGHFGSSPLARGTRTDRPERIPALRLIPARAGNTLPKDSVKSLRAAHPRSRGEHPAAGTHAIPSVGSSPLARGTPHTRINARSHTRLIPARAGNTPPYHPHHRHRPAHPRSRGEHHMKSRMFPMMVGSSPLARGTRLHSDRRHLCCRLIPARAGNTAGLWWKTAPSPAHPRSRGEHVGVVGDEQVGFGSSPLARGTPIGSYSGLLISRLIPARAGNTCSKLTPSSSNSAHPRSRGEHPPHAGGVAPPPAHPRSRGEHTC